MKKIVLFISLIFIFTPLLGCENDDDFYKFPEVCFDICFHQIKVAIEEEGYDFEQQAADDVEDYQLNSINNLYSISIDLIDIFSGTDNLGQNEADILIFDSVDDAEAYMDAIDLQDTTGLLYFHADGNVVVITYIQSVIDKLNTL